MEVLILCQLRHLGFGLIILLASSACNGNPVTVDVEGFMECVHDNTVGATSSESSPGTGLLMNIDCKSTDGNLRRLGTGEVVDTENFKIKFLQDKNIEDQVERGSCFLKLDGSSGPPCPGREGQNVLVMISKSTDAIKQISAKIRNLKFSSITCTSTPVWPSDKNEDELIHIPPSPGKTLRYPHQPSVKDFLSTKSGLMETFPASVKNNLKQLSSLMSRKLLSLPQHFFEPKSSHLPVIQYPSPQVASPVGNQTPTLIRSMKPKLSPKPPSSNYNPSPVPTFSSPKLLPPPTPIIKNAVRAPPPISRMLSPPVVSIPTEPPRLSRPNLEKPLPPIQSPVPGVYNPPPPLAQAPEFRQSLPPLAPYIEEPPPQPTPRYKNAPPNFQRLAPSAAPAPMVKLPHFPLLAPTYEDLILAPAPTPHLKKPLQPVAPVPTYNKPTIPPPMQSPGPILQKPNPPPVPTFKKSVPPPHPPVPIQQPNAPLHPPISPKLTTPAPSHPARPVLQKPIAPPVPTSHKSVSPPLPSPNAQAYPPISPTPVSQPSPETAHNSAPSPLPITNPTPQTKQPPLPPASRRKSFYPIPRAPPLPELPPVPSVPRRYFNLPKYGSQPTSPPS